ncbi:MAG: NAD(+)/NADH kinase, partial [Firmicutes bacterium]|nr:NAD(+)/NADH kinase [Bacillota bacterium]
MKTIGFITNLEKDPELSYTEGLIKFAQEKGCKALIKESFREKIKYGDAVPNTEKIYENADFLIVLGGDGTILRAARKAVGYELPILGVNIGTLGYLADVERNDAYEAIEKILDYDYKIEKRMMLEVYTEEGGGVGEPFTVLNEVVLRNGIFSRLIEISLTINDQYFDTYRA